MEDKILVAGIKKRRSRSLEAAIDKYGPTVYALCARILGNPAGQQDVEECVSDTFLAAWQRIGQFKAERGSFRTWLLMLGRYQALDMRRRLSGNVQVADITTMQLSDAASAREFSGIEERQILQRALSELDKMDRELVYRRYYLFESVEQLAKDYNLTSKAVYNRLWRARKFLQENLATANSEGVE
ncbi:MAG: sigma-70 family RNA polymerase sigma factor [Firmicutes bacterium]|nr:sigma-70 family RNA polymerase sigma factor [Bacillota bacterium]